MKYRNYQRYSGPGSQRGVSLIVAMIMLIVLTLIGVSSMNTATVELKMAGSAQQQTQALNRANEALRAGEVDVEAIVANPAAFDFAAADDGYYVTADAIDVYDLDWEGLDYVNYNDGQVDLQENARYIAEYLGAKAIPGESVKVGTDGRIIGGAVHTFRITARSATGKGALRLVQSIYVTPSPP